ncbi:MAG TPA: hydrophobin family protein [Chlamydiales bacterium]|nr:hydrophobin family protein [Chlamydiales bacterium]
MCCNSAGAANVLPGVNAILGLLNIAIDPITALVGLSCTSLVYVSAFPSLSGLFTHALPFSGGACGGDAVCCTDNHAHGLVSHSISKFHCFVVFRVNVAFFVLKQIAIGCLNIVL